MANYLYFCIIEKNDQIKELSFERYILVRMNISAISVPRLMVCQIVLCLAMILSLEVQAKIKRALLIGISDYNTSGQVSDSLWHNIHGANDVAILSPTLKKRGYIAESLCDKTATAKKIREALNELAKQCHSGDEVYLHFSCHGQPVEDLNGDEEDGWDEAIVPVDARKVYSREYSGNRHIIDDELNLVFEKIRKKIGREGYLVVAIDACHSGTSYRGDEEQDSVIIRGTNKGFSARGKPFVPKIDRRSKFKLKSSKDMSDVCLIEACRSYQVNCEIKENGKYYGSLSFYLNKFLEKSGFGRDSKWCDEVLRLIGADYRLIRQNAVVEISE